MATTTPSAALVPVTPVFANTERLALAGFLAGYSGLTRQAYELDLRQYAAWCQQHQVRLFDARRADIECFARDLEARGRARATITRRRPQPSLTPSSRPPTRARTTTTASVSSMPTTGMLHTPCALPIGIDAPIPGLTCPEPPP